MSLSRLLQKIFVLLIVCQNLLARDSAQPNTWSLDAKVETVTPQPSAEQRARWEENLFESETVLSFKDKASANRIIKNSGLDAELIEILMGQLDRGLNTDQEIQSVPYIPENGVRLLIPHQLYPRLTKRFIRKVYRHQLNQLQYLGLSVSYKSKAEFQSFTSTMPADQQIAVERHTIKLGGIWRTLLNPFNWQYSTPYWKSGSVNTMLSDNPKSATGLSVELLIQSEQDLERIWGRLPSSPELQKAREKIETQIRAIGFPIEIPLEEFLPAFARANINRFPDRHGPNCFNSGTSFFSEGDVRPHYCDGPRLLESIYKKYRLVTREEGLQPGDLLVYINSKDSVTHVSSFLTRIRNVDTGELQEIVFVKNGLNKFRPYIFQERRMNESVYFKESEGFKVLALRLSPNPEYALDPSGKGQNLKLIYFDERADSRPGKTIVQKTRDKIDSLIAACRERF